MRKTYVTTWAKVVHKNVSQGYKKVKLHIMKNLHYEFEMIRFQTKQKSEKKVDLM